MRRAEHGLSLLTYDRWGIIASKESIWKQEEGGGQRVRMALKVVVLLCAGDSKKNEEEKRLHYLKHGYFKKKNVTTVKGAALKTCEL